jgi:hypothetical protein
MIESDAACMYCDRIFFIQIGVNCADPTNVKKVIRSSM